MKNLTQILKPKSIKMSILGLVKLFLLNSCTKEEQKQEVKKEEWVEVKNKTFFEGKAYDIIFKSDKNSKKIEFIQNFPKEVQERLKPYEEAKTMVQEFSKDENGNQIVYIYKNEEDFEQNSAYFKEMTAKMSQNSTPANRLKSYNGGAVRHWEHSRGNGWNILNYTNQWANWGTSTTYFAYGILNPWVGSWANDRISSIEFFQIDRSERFQYRAYENSNYGGLNIYMNMPAGGPNYRFYDLWTQPMSYTLWWTNSWND